MILATLSLSNEDGILVSYESLPPLSSSTKQLSNFFPGLVVDDKSSLSSSCSVTMNPSQPQRAKKVFFSEDVVYKTCRRRGKTHVGIIVRGSESESESEAEEDSTSASSSRQKSVQPGQTKVAWYPSGFAEVIEESKVNSQESFLSFRPYTFLFLFS